MSPWRAAGGSVSPFRTRVGELVRGPARTIALESTAGEAARAMRDGAVGALVVMEAGQPAGIVTEADMARRVLAQGHGPDAPLDAFVSSPLIGIDANRPLFEALMAMLRTGIGHLAVFEQGRLIGVISERDWLRMQERHPAALFREIEAAERVEALAALRREALALARRLFGEDGAAAALTALLSEINDRVGRRVIELALAAMERRGPLPARFAWLAMGSEGRGEQTLATDQDNGILFEDVPAAGREAVQRWFLGLAERAVEGLENCGFARCKGDVMASNPELCLPLEGWEAKFTRLIAEPDPAALLKASIYFDFRVLVGDQPLGESLWGWLLERIAHNPSFLNHLAAGLADHRPIVSRPFWRLRVALGMNPGDVNLKREAVLPLVHGLRVMALGLGVAASNSLARLEALRGAGALAPEKADALAGAFEFLTLLRVRHQFAQAERGEPADNVLVFRTLDPLQQRFLIDALKTVRDFQDYVIAEHGGFKPG